MAEKSGFLTKQGGSIKTWKKRWCVLKNGVIHYSKSAKSGVTLGTIDLAQSEYCRENVSKKKNFCFELHTPERVFFMFADTRAEMESWVQEIEASRTLLRKSLPAGGVPPAVAPSGAASASTATGGGGGGGATSAPYDPVAAAALERSKKVAYDDFIVDKVIGKGSFGKVLLVRKKDTGKVYAMKVLNKKSIQERNEEDHTMTERSILTKVVHPFLVNLYYSFQTPDNLYFVMDYVNGGELFHHLQKDKKFTPERARFYAAEICLGLEYLHQMGVLYRDLKPENLLLTHDGHICMTDFGISKEGLDHDGRTDTFCGTPEYLAPEVLEGVGYGKAVDWWSFGTLIFEMLTGLPPFYSPDVQQMYQQIMSAKLQIPPNFSPEAKDLIEKLLERDPTKRCADAKAIKAHPFFAGLDWDALYRKELSPPFKPQVSGDASTENISDEFVSQPLGTSILPGSEMAAAGPTFDNFTFTAESALARAH